MINGKYKVNFTAVIYRTLAIIMLIITIRESYQQGTPIVDVDTKYYEAVKIKKPQSSNVDQFEEYRIREITDNHGKIEIDYIYDQEKLGDKMVNTDREEFLEILEAWNYTTSEDKLSPYDTIDGESNCQGITMYIVEWLNANVNPKEYKYALNVRTVDTETDIMHMYPTVKPFGGYLEVWDMVEDKEGTISYIKKFLMNI